MFEMSFPLRGKHPNRSVEKNALGKKLSTVVTASRLVVLIIRLFNIEVAVRIHAWIQDPLIQDTGYWIRETTKK